MEEYGEIHIEEPQKNQANHKKAEKTEQIEADLGKASNLDAVLEAIKFPAGIADLDTCLPNVDRDTLSHLRKRGKFKKRREEKAAPRRVEREGRLEMTGVYEDAFPSLHPPRLASHRLL